jgi:hypothetical protein
MNMSVFGECGEFTVVSLARLFLNTPKEDPNIRKGRQKVHETPNKIKRIWRVRPARKLAPILVNF